MDQSNEYGGYHQTMPPWGFENIFQQDLSQADSLTEQTTSFGFQQQDPNMFQFNPNFGSGVEANPGMDYETLIRTRDLYYDPNPQVIRKPSMGEPLVYNQNVVVRFLQPPPVVQGPLIIREVRPPQPPPPPPLVIRQRAPPPLSPPPLILRERPPPMPASLPTQVVTKTLPPLPPPPRSVIIEKLPALPPKPRDIIIERWVPYEAPPKRKVIVHRAEAAKSYPPPKNVIITYEPVQARVVRHFQRLGATPEDPRNYFAQHGNSLLESAQLLLQMRELGIIDDISLPRAKAYPSPELAPFVLNESNFNYNISSQETQTYAPTFENLVQSSSSTFSYPESPNQSLPHEEDLSAQFAQYGLTTELIPH